jgi:carboxylesterase type B
LLRRFDVLDRRLATSSASRGCASSPRRTGCRFQGYWSRLALAGDPNGEGAPDWPAFTAASDAHLVLGDTVSASTGLGADHCDFWDTIARPTLPLFRTE